MSQGELKKLTDKMRKDLDLHGAKAHMVGVITTPEKMIQFKIDYHILFGRSPDKALLDMKVIIDEVLYRRGITKGNN